MNTNGSSVALHSRLEALIVELAAVESELQQCSHTVHGHSIPPELLDRFKAAVDKVRLRIWAYMDTRYPGLGKDMQQVLQQRRMERATEMLVALREEAATHGLAAGHHVDALMEQIRGFHELLVRQS